MVVCNKLSVVFVIIVIIVLSTQFFFKVSLTVFRKGSTMTNGARFNEYRPLSRRVEGFANNNLDSSNTADVADQEQQTGTDQSSSNVDLTQQHSNVDDLKDQRSKVTDRSSSDINFLADRKSSRQQSTIDDFIENRPQAFDSSEIRQLHDSSGDHQNSEVDGFPDSTQGSVASDFVESVSQRLSSRGEFKENHQEPVVDITDNDQSLTVKYSNDLLEKTQPTDEGKADVINSKTLKNSWKTKPPREHVLLLAYMRSGSSFVGSVLQNNPHVMYIFEPLFTLNSVYKRKETPLTFLFKPPYFLKSRKLDDVGDEILSSFLSCNFTNLDLQTLTQFHLQRGRLLPYYVCIRQNHATYHDIVRCLHLLYEECQQRNVSMAKTIRLSVTNALRLVGRDPLLKVIHLVRDPRAIISSRLRLGAVNATVETESRGLCKQMLDDVISHRHIEDKFRHRVKLVRYEDIVENPITVFRELYKFMDIPFMKEQRDYITSLTTKQMSEPCQYCVEGRLASEVAQAWRYDMSYRTVQLIDESCHDLYNILGYIPVEDTSHLLNIGRKLYI